MRRLAQALNAFGTARRLEEFAGVELLRKVLGQVLGAWERDILHRTGRAVVSNRDAGAQCQEHRTCTRLMEQLGTCDAEGIIARLKDLSDKERSIFPESLTLTFSGDE